MISRVSRLTLLICSMGEVLQLAKLEGSGIEPKDGPPTEVSCQETTDSRPNGWCNGCN